MNELNITSFCFIDFISQSLINIKKYKRDRNNFYTYFKSFSKFRRKTYSSSSSSSSSSSASKMIGLGE